MPCLLLSNHEAGHILKPHRGGTWIMIMIRIILIILVVVVVVIIIIIEIPVILKYLSSFKIVICMSCYFQHQACQLCAQASHALTKAKQQKERWRYLRTAGGVVSQTSQEHSDSTRKSLQLLVDPQRHTMSTGTWRNHWNFSAKPSHLNAKDGNLLTINCVLPETLSHAFTKCSQMRWKCSFTNVHNISRAMLSLIQPQYVVSTVLAGHFVNALAFGSLQRTTQVLYTTQDQLCLRYTLLNGGCMRLLSLVDIKTQIKTIWPWASWARRFTRAPVLSC